MSVAKRRGGSREVAKLTLVANEVRASRAPPPRGRRTRTTPKSEQTRTVILEAAVDAVGRYGIRGATLSRVAELAEVTRGCLQYYFVTSEDIVVALAQHVGQQTWRSYEARALHPPEGRDLIEFAIDLIANPAHDRYRVARLELLTAARTVPALRPVLIESARQVEDQAKRFTARLFGHPGLADTAQFRAARDLANLVDDWLWVQVFPDQREQRIEDVRTALRVALHTLWRSPSLGREPDAPRPRIRVKAAGRREDEPGRVSAQPE